MQVSLIQGAYEARSLIANAQRCVNLYPEQNTKDATAPFTHYLTPGLRKLAQGPSGEVRGLYTASNGELFAVIGNGIYFVPDTFVLVFLGAISTAQGAVSMYDNRTTLIVLDGGTFGWQIDLVTHAYALYNPANFAGGNQIRYIDTFLVSSVLDANMQTSDSLATTYTGLAIATISGDADFLQIIDVVHKEVWAFGKRSTEVWSNVGGFPFPLAPIPGVFIPHGIAANRSLAKWGLNIFWLSEDNNGQALVMMGGPTYQAEPVSTPAIADQISTYERIDDAIGFCYQQGAHIFYVLTFPQADKTWVYDLSEKLWHERAWSDENGEWHRCRANCLAHAYGKTVVGDWENGAIYAWEPHVYTDDGDPIVRLRSFPHLVNELNRVSYKEFTADMETGADTLPANLPLVSLRWSDDRGKTYSNAMMQSLGQTGQYSVNISWRRLGMARDRVFELSWSADCETALNGAYVELEPAET